MNIEGNDNAENGASKIRAGQGASVFVPQSNSHKLYGPIQDRAGNQSERGCGDFNKKTNAVIREIFRGGEFNQAALLGYIKKLASRLELLEAESASLAEEQSHFISDHRDRLLKRLGENEEFARRSEETRQKLAQGRSALRQEITELTRVLGASELEITTE